MRLLKILIFGLLLACQPAQKDEKVDLDSLKDEVFEIHDEVMPKMGDLRKTRKNLMTLADSIIVSDSTRASNLLELAGQIEAANESMRQWMRNFDPDFEGTYEERLNYLNEQKGSITQVRKEMLESLEAGQAKLNDD